MSSYLKQIHLADGPDDQRPHKYVKITLVRTVALSGPDLTSRLYLLILQESGKVSQARERCGKGLVAHVSLCCHQTVKCDMKKMVLPH